MQDKCVKQYQLKHHVRCTFRYVHPCNLPRPNALLCICESGGGHYTNHRGDTLGASPKTQEQETGMKNFETFCQQYTKTSQCIMEVFLVQIALSDKSKYEKVQQNVFPFLRQIIQVYECFLPVALIGRDQRKYT